MSLRQIKKQLRELPYTEMKALAAQVSNMLLECKFTPLSSPTVIADTLADLPMDDGVEIDTEQKYFNDLFSRTRAIKITPNPGGLFHFSMSGTDVVTNSTSLRNGMSEFLDLVAAMEAMNQGVERKR